jgi:hypothetical protein
MNLLHTTNPLHTMDLLHAISLLHTTNLLRRICPSTFLPQRNLPTWVAHTTSQLFMLAPPFLLPRPPPWCIHAIVLHVSPQSLQLPQ